MKIIYPFYGRLFDIFSKIKTKSWFKGQEKTAAKLNANIFILYHQILAFNFGCVLYKNLTHLNFQISPFIYFIFAILSYVLNWMLFYKWHIQTKPSKIIDIIYLSSFISTLVGLHIILFYPELLHF